MAVDDLLADLGLSRHPAVEPSWSALRHMPSWQQPGGPAHPTILAGLTRLGRTLVSLRPARHPDILHVWRQLPVPARSLRHRVIPLHLHGRVPSELVVTTGGVSAPVADALGAGSPVARHLQALARQDRLPSVVVLVVHLEHLPAPLLAAADDLPWERLLGGFAPGQAHLIRLVGARPPHRTPEAVQQVGFLADPYLSSAAVEQDDLKGIWGNHLRPGLGRADIVHVHAHGMGGAIGGMELRDVQASVAVFNACEGALLGGVVREAVTSGHVTDSFGFSEPVLTETGRILTLAVHPHLYTWRDDSRAGVVQAALAGRQALGRRLASSSWRHYRAAHPIGPPAQAH